MVWKALPRLKIAVACQQDWNAMAGDDKVRFCGQCCQNVYNVRQLRPREVAALIESHGERMPCLRLYHRPDGTVITRSCLDWVHAGVQVMRWSAWSVAALAVGFWSQVWLWHGRLHPRRSLPTLVAHQETAAPKPSRRVPPLRHWLERPGAVMGAPPPSHDGRPRREKDGPGPTEGQVRLVVAQMNHAFHSELVSFPSVGRVQVDVTVSPSGHVSKVRIAAPAAFLPVQQRFEAIVKHTRFPRSSVEYVAEFPIMFQH